MKKFILMVTSLSISILCLPSAFAATSEVTWTGYDKYQDVREGNYTEEGFKDLLTKKLEEHIAELSAKLPKDQTLKMDVTDVNLAGDVRVASMSGTRIMKNGYPPQMSFSYQLIDASGKVIKSDEVSIRDVDFLTRLPLKYRNKIFGYEKKMLDDWFKKTFKS